MSTATKWKLSKRKRAQHTERRFWRESAQVCGGRWTKPAPLWFACPERCNRSPTWWASWMRTMRRTAGCTRQRRASSRREVVLLLNAQLFLDLLQRHAFGLGNHRLHPNELENHHA